jgi:hypothetical protein
MRRIIRALEMTPLAFGEPTYPLPALRLHVRTAVIAPISVGFAVADDQPLVYIKVVKLLAEG